MDPVAGKDVKTCSKCHVTKPIEEYYPSHYTKDGWSNQCDLCQRAYANARYARETEARKRGDIHFDTPSHKVCNRCGEDKPIAEYGNALTKDGKSNRCRHCCNEDTKRRNRIKAEERRCSGVPICELVAKVCNRCGIEKPIGEFYKQNHKKDGRDTFCAVCRREQSKHYAERNKTFVSDSQTPVTKVCSHCGQNLPLTEFHNGSGRHAKVPRCKSCVKAWGQRYYLDNKEHILRRSKAWKHANPEKEAAINARARAKQRQSLQWQLDRRILRKVDRYAKHGISRIMRSQSEYAAGWTFGRLREYIISLFTEGMTWELVLDGKIEIDHIIPRCSFYYESIYDQDFKDCWALSNLRPLWKPDNRRKAYKMPDGSNGRLIGKRKQELYELRLAQMAAGGTSELPSEIEANPV